MLIEAKKIKGYKIIGNDGEVGKVKEFYFDRYIVADTDNWLEDRHVLISPNALVSVNKETESIHINLFKKQIKDSPSLTSEKFISRQFEIAYHLYYGWPMYWDNPLKRVLNHLTIKNHKQLELPIKDVKFRNPHLRSSHDVSSYHIQATDGEIGHIIDFIVDIENWTIRYLIINTHNWWAGKNMLVSPQWIERVSWKELKVFINLSRESIKLSPEYSAEILLTRDYETQLHRYYNRNVYWNEKQSDMKSLL
jgi:sporulation protein YlmC with PRC-barrel domain